MNRHSSHHHHHAHHHSLLPEPDESAEEEAPLAKAKHEYFRLTQRAAIVSLGVGFTLSLTKLVVWWWSGYLVVLSSAIDSLMDFSASIITWWALRAASDPADSEHRFGHGKAEPLASLAMSAFIGVSVAGLIWQSLQALLTPKPAYSHSGPALFVMIFSIALTLGLVLYQRWVIRKTASSAISADSLHYRSDLIQNLAVISSILLASYIHFPLADALGGLAIAAYLAYGVYGIAKHAIDMLMDTDAGQEIRQQVMEIVTTIKEVQGVHLLKTRLAGPYLFIQMHIVLDGEMSLHDAHEVSELLESRLKKKFFHSEVIIHMDPTGQHNPDNQPDWYQES